MKNTIITIIIFSHFIFNCSTGGRKYNEKIKSPEKYIYNLPSYYVTTKDRYSRMGSVSITLVTVDKKTISKISGNLGRINKKINSMLKNKSYSDMDSDEGKKNLSMEIKREINIILSNGKIKDVIFNEFILN